MKLKKYKTHNMNDNGIFSILSGDKPIQVSIGIDYISGGILAAAIFVAGFLLIVIGKKI